MDATARSGEAFRCDLRVGKIDQWLAAHAASRHAREGDCAPCRRLRSWMRAERARLSRHAEVAKAMDYMLKRWTAFTRFLEDGRVCLSNQCGGARAARHRT